MTGYINICIISNRPSVSYLFFLFVGNCTPENYYCINNDCISSFTYIRLISSRASEQLCIKEAGFCGEN